MFKKPSSLQLKFAVPLVIFVVIAVSGVSMAWWDANWQYRVPVTVTETSGSSLTDYQVKITLDTASLISAGKMNADCSDIRVVDSDDLTALSFWVEDGTCNTASTVIWAKVPSLTASSSKTIYVYYGNSGATSASDITNTFILGDDFNDGVLAGTAIDGTWTESGGILSQTLDTTTGLDNSYDMGALTVTDNIIFEAKAKTDAINAGWFGIALASGSTTYVDGVLDIYNNWARIMDISSDAIVTDVSSPITTDETAYHIIKLTRTGTTYTVEIEGVTATLTSSLVPTNAYLQSRRASDYFDYAYVRKYASSEPTTTVGSEEQNVAISITSITITPSTLYTNTDATCDAQFSSAADTAELTWYVNSVAVKNASCTSCFSISDTLPSSNFVKGDVVNCTVSATAGATTVVASIETTVQNTPPTAPTDISWPTPVIEKNITVAASGSTDIDGDAITYYYQFYDVNTSTILQAYSTDDTYYVPTSLLGHLLRVYAKAYDGTDFSGEYYEEATVMNVTVKINSPTNTTYITDTVTLNFTVADPVPFNCTIYLDGVNIDKTSQSEFQKDYTISTPGSHNFKVVCDDADGNTLEDIVYFTLKFDIRIELYDEQTKASLGGFARIHNGTYVDEQDLTYRGIVNKASTACEKTSASNWCSFSDSQIQAYSSDATWVYAYANISNFSYATFKFWFDSVDNVNYGRAEISLATGYSTIKMFDFWNDISSSDATKLEVIYLNGVCYIYINNTYKAEYSGSCQDPEIQIKVSTATTAQATTLYLSDTIVGGKSYTWYDVLGEKWLEGYSDILYAGTFHLKYPMRGLYSTENIIDGKLYLLPDSQGVYSTVLAKRLSGEPLRGKILTFYRVNPTEKLKVFECKTDDAGQCIVFADPNVRYIVEYYDTKEQREVQFASGQTYTLVFEKSDLFIPPYVPAVSCDIQTTYTNCTVSADYLTLMNLTVSHYHDFQTMQLCAVSNYISAGNLYCNYTEVTNGTVMVKVEYLYDDVWRTAYSDNMFIPKTEFGDVGIYFMLGLFLISGLVVLLNPIAGILMLGVSAYIGTKLGLIPGGQATWVFIAVAGGIILWRAVKG